MALPFSQYNVHVQGNNAMGLGSMHVGDDDDFVPNDFYPQIPLSAPTRSHHHPHSPNQQWGMAPPSPSNGPFSEQTWQTAFTDGTNFPSPGRQHAMSSPLHVSENFPGNFAPAHGTHSQTFSAPNPDVNNSPQNSGCGNPHLWQSACNQTASPNLSSPPLSQRPSGLTDIERRLTEMLSQNENSPHDAPPVLVPSGSAPDLHPNASPAHSEGTVQQGHCGPANMSNAHARSNSTGAASVFGNAVTSSPEAPQTPSGCEGEAPDDSRVLTMPAHCPPILHRKIWSIKQFNLENVLYVGSISRVLRAVDRATNVTVALKVYKRHSLSDMEKYQVAREIRMHSELYHDNIISLYCAWKDSQYIYVAVEWAPNGDIYSMLKRFGREGVAEHVVVTKIFRPLLSALEFIHARGLIHRDLKPENILLGDNYNIKLSDFGLSINQYHEVANTRLGTLNYIAPEILQCPYKHHPLENKGESAVGYDNKVDVWSLGVLAYELLTSELPFCGGGMRETLQKIMMNQVVFPHNRSPLARDFMAVCLQTDPTRRPTIAELQRHPWISGSYEGVPH